VPITDEPGPAHPQPEENSRHGRLTARPAPPVATSDRTGLVPFTADGELLALAYVPDPVPDRPYRLVLLLHGAGGSPRQALDVMLPFADEQHLLLLAPQSAATSWDLVIVGFGPDIRRIDRLLEEVLATHRLAGMTVGGFSDGASYALSIGLINGDIFDTIVAYSPGFAAPLVTHGKPRVFVSHGSADRVLPIDRCSRRVVPQLRALDYEVTYEEFDGGHEVPVPTVQHSLDWLNRSRARSGSYSNGIS
jgi:phospholipase/carboxylesterase